MFSSPQSHDFLPGLSLETLIVIPVKTGIQLFQRLAGFLLARERRKAKVLFACGGSFKR
jgi:hypothetical protein